MATVVFGINPPSATPIGDFVRAGGVTRVLGNAAPPHGVTVHTYLLAGSIDSGLVIPAGATRIRSVTR